MQDEHGGERVIWKWSDCARARMELAAGDFDLDAFEPEVVARIERATGRAFGFGAVSGMEAMS